MNLIIKQILRYLAFLLLFGSLFPTFLHADPPPPGDRFRVSGAIKNLQGKGIKEVEVAVRLDGRHLKPIGKEETISNHGKWHSLVVPGLGGLSGWQRHHDRGLGQRGDRGPGRESGNSYLLSVLHESLLCAHADHGYFCVNLLSFFQEVRGCG